MLFRRDGSWKSGKTSLPGRTDLVTEEGEPIKIIYPGRINDDRGADLLDAVIATSQGLIRGDIEVHVKSSSWWAHRHHLDPIYNRVILHVVFWHDTETAINLQNGQKVPTLALHKFIKTRLTGTSMRYIPQPIGICPAAML